MDAKTAAEYLRSTADAIEKMERFQSCAIVIPPENPNAPQASSPIEIILSGVAPANFAQYVIDQIALAASPRSNSFGR